MDRREAILVQLLAVCQGIGIARFERGLLVASDLSEPVGALHDGDEVAADSDPVLRPNIQPRKVTMQPALAIRAIGSKAAVGTLLNGYRTALVKAVVYDAELASLTRLGAGSVRYEGCGLVLDEGRSAIGTMMVNLGITYVFNPAEL